MIIPVCCIFGCRKYHEDDCGLHTDLFYLDVKVAEIVCMHSFRGKKLFRLETIRVEVTKTKDNKLFCNWLLSLYNGSLDAVCDQDLHWLIYAGLSPLSIERSVSARPFNSNPHSKSLPHPGHINELS